MYDLKSKNRYWKLKEKALDRTLWRTHLGRGCEPIIRGGCDDVAASQCLSTRRFAFR